VDEEAAMMTDATCSKCGTVLAAAAVLYDERGVVLCQRCLMGAQALDAEKNAATKVRSIAYSGPAIGIVAMLFNPFWLLSIGAILNGVYVLRSVRHPETIKHLAPSIAKMKVAAIAGMVLGALAGVLRLFV